MPIRLRIAWQDDTTLKLETDAGMQTRMLQFGSTQGSGGDWPGLDHGSGLLGERTIRVQVDGRGAAARPRTGALVLAS